MTHLVVINPAGQYSVWPRARRLPAGWRSAGFDGSEAACLDHVDATWLDLRPVTEPTR
ncbi:MbtH family NRPS accessory protein [Kineosporia succinea]|uniref:MbtH protein n=1 Tax=Kineosporia succinea TaxID=84632 RepID=A0ABT9PBX4_9ACTN|nr:MbtH family NRPS accessory protein [Kineosporia succinea]MDP9830201.1 MbtH protein [Kineosporia succinea]